MLVRRAVVGFGVVLEQTRCCWFLGVCWCLGCVLVLGCGVVLVGDVVVVVRDPNHASYLLLNLSTHPPTHPPTWSYGCLLIISTAM